MRPFTGASCGRFLELVSPDARFGGIAERRNDAPVSTDQSSAARRAVLCSAISEIPTTPAARIARRGQVFSKRWGWGSSESLDSASSAGFAWDRRSTRTVSVDLLGFREASKTEARRGKDPLFADLGADSTRSHTKKQRPQIKNDGSFGWRGVPRVRRDGG